MSETKKCPYCGGEIKAVAIKCWHCGKFLAQEEEHTADDVSVPITAAPQDEAGELDVDKLFADDENNLQAEPELTGMAKFVDIIAWLCYVFAIIDVVSNNFFDTDLTGCIYSPIIAGVIGAVLQVVAKKINK